MARKAKTEEEEPLVKKLWKAADKLRKNMDAAEYKHVVLGLIFLKYISDSFEEHYNYLAQVKAGKVKPVDEDDQYADLEDNNEYKQKKIFYVPPSARWKWIQGRATQPTIGKDIDDAMDAIEKDNTSLKGVLPKVYAQEKLDKTSLGGLVNLVGSATLGTKEAQSKDLLGQVFEYFLGEFALAEGKKGGQFYTPGSVVKLLVEMLEPYEGRVFDPCCGSGGMFVQSEKFIKKHQDHYRKKGVRLNATDPISIYGQESNQTTWRLAMMNLSIRGIDSSNVKWNNEGSFLNDLHKDLKADYIIANPPFNDSDWSGELLREDARWSVLGEKLVPPAGNANYAWIQHFLYHLSPTGQAGFVLSKGALTTNTTGEGDIRKALIENDLVECIVNLPTKLFLNTQIPACLWFLKKNKQLRKGEILFIDARNMGVLINRKNRVLTDQQYFLEKTGIEQTGEIEEIAAIYHNWRALPPLGGVGGGLYEDVAGFCKVATIDEVRKLNYVLTPGRYVGLADEEDDFIFEERFNSLKEELEKQIAEEAELNRKIAENLSKIKIPANG